ncbi:hypothetical protein GPECTOR_35g829 [Gonium pectorale]|uniref:DEK-C domain-containing protein n=1 Tax=Gonium pectorale TaxID=33097 RepID=A0A150GC12_GONPE|nr:hypothetical protein GPECTOR_35g829 [Gonium pectorale]|eukprot:KXZ47391.1 hypothetical protein GPECTOR_35g829 [Gonium pectorale]
MLADAAAAAGGGGGQAARRAMPSDEEVKAAAAAVLRVSDVSRVNMKNLMAALQERFGVDLTAKRQWIQKYAAGFADEQAKARSGSRPGITSSGR